MNDEERKLRIAIPVPEEDVEKYYINYFNALGHLGAKGEIVMADCDPADFDGLLMPGGADIDPIRYHCRNMGSVQIDDTLDELQFAVLDSFIRAGKPVFGICRGHQIINSYFGGTLQQNIPAYARHARTPGIHEDKVHAARAVKGSFIEALYGENFSTNSSHHQAVENFGEGLIVQQWSDDGYVEAMRHTSLPVRSVQWHPERMCFERARTDTVDGSLVIADFLKTCIEMR